ncbi:preprotein translocase subunit SecG [bacterium]|jgi:protein translocase SecG subunit|nr:preprotein translocase subunit SecG [bacterium]MBT6831928.1 preprotein translocase subunit SecG [bacterium]MBT6996624.1 preprotein translocase subunit SecG [bacterium]MBT7773044.1 preprotein translocase subunit SecG [bacterium]
MFQTFFIVVSVLFMIVVLLQQKNSSLGSLMGADSGDEIAQTRRGAEKFLHQATIVLAVLFIGGGMWAMFS